MTATDLTGGQNVAIIGGASADGNLITENCGLQKTDGQAWSYANQTSMSEKLYRTNTFHDHRCSRGSQPI